MRDPIDKKTYAQDQVVWFVRQGQEISEDQKHIDRQFFRTYLKGQRQPWDSRIVICNSRAKNLPDSLKEGEEAVKTLCTMRSDLTSVPDSEFEKRKKHWWQCNKSETHYQAKYTIRFQLNSAGIDSQLLFKGQQYSKPNSFNIQWEAGANMAAPKEHRKEVQANYDRYYRDGN